MEVKDEAAKSTEPVYLQNHRQNEEFWAVRPYGGEPIADASWVENYYEQRRHEEAQLQNLRSCLNRYVTVESWRVSFYFKPNPVPTNSTSKKDQLTVKAIAMRSTLHEGAPFRPLNLSEKVKIP